MQGTLFERLERLIEAMIKEFSHGGIGFGETTGTTAVDIAEEDGEFVAVCDLPGFDKDDITLRVTDHTLHIHAEHAGEEGSYLHRERRRTDVSRSVTLPEELDADAVSATYENGVLTVTMPKAHAEDHESHLVPIS